VSRPGQTFSKVKDFLYLILLFFFFAKAFVKAAQELSMKETSIIYLEVTACKTLPASAVFYPSMNSSLPRCPSPNIPDFSVKPHIMTSKCCLLSLSTTRTRALRRWEEVDKRQFAQRGYGISVAL